jgi:hypothetical protein
MLGGPAAVVDMLLCIRKSMGPAVVFGQVDQSCSTMRQGVPAGSVHHLAVNSLLRVVVLFAIRWLVCVRQTR